MEFPKWIYSKKGESKIVYSSEDLDRHSDWAQSPADFKVKSIKKKKVAKKVKVKE